MIHAVDPSLNLASQLCFSRVQILRFEKRRRKRGFIISKKEKSKTIVVKKGLVS